MFKRFKAYLKNIIKLFGINKLLGYIFAIGIEDILKRDPYLYGRLKTAYEKKVRADHIKSLKHVGTNCEFKGVCKITVPDGLSLGNNVHIGEGGYFFSRGGIYIGDNTHISRNVAIYSANHDYKDGTLPYNSLYTDRPVWIGEDVWIGMNVNILPGVTIGDGAIIGMGVTVSKDVKPLDIVVGQGNRVIGQRDSDFYKHYKMEKVYGGAAGVRVPQELIRQYNTSLAQHDITPIFIVSTGRAGSTSIASILNRHRDITALHEPKSELVKLSTQYLHGEINRDYLYKRLENIFLKFPVTNTPIYVESDQKLSNMVSILSEILPRSKFVWIIRRPEACINSTWSRGWFSDFELGYSDLPPQSSIQYRQHFSDYRPRAPMCSTMVESEWKALGSFGRNCWYWQYWNTMISEEFTKLDPTRKLKIRLEKLDSDLGAVENLIGIESGCLENLVINEADSITKLRTTSDWTGKMKEIYNSIVDETLYSSSVP